MQSLLDLTSVAASANTRLVKDINALTRQQQYRSIANNYLTYFGYETKATILPGRPSSVIVPKSSALPPSCSPSETIELSTDHVRLSKFEDESDNNLQLLLTTVQSMVEGIQLRARERWDNFRGGQTSRSPSRL
jgi:hypothetical protein